MRSSQRLSDIHSGCSGMSRKRGNDDALNGGLEYSSDLPFPEQF